MTYDYFEEQAILGNIEYAERQMEMAQGVVDHWKERIESLRIRASDMRRAHEAEERAADRRAQ